MWSYYGRKSKVVKHYPQPLYDVIVEPFAGTAAYSLFDGNWKKRVILIDKYDKIIKIWKYLQTASKHDILTLPDLDNGWNINDFGNYLCDEEKWLIGFCINRGSANPKITPMKFNSWPKDKIRIANEIYKIRHWEIIQGEYNSIDNILATWYIDPPYQFGSKYYRHSNINYDELSEWCKSRNGQIIVCENISATWMDFSSLINLHGQKHETTEAIWYKDNQSVLDIKDI